MTPPIAALFVEEREGAFPYLWRVRTRLPDRHGQPCRVNVRGAMNSCEVEFEDGFKVITSRNYLRRRPLPARTTEVG